MNHRRPGGILFSTALALGLFGFFLAPVAMAQDALNNLFQQGKTEFREGNYTASLETFSKLDELSRAPGAEAARAKLEPILAFYRGANLAALGRKDEAREEFGGYLSLVPNARLDPAMFPKQVIEVYNQARKKAAADAPAEGDTTLAREYATSYAGSQDGPVAFPDERWTEGPMRYFMTKEEKAEWKNLQSAAERVEFVARFWQRRDPTMKDEIARRLRFADVRFRLNETPGNETDRGLVFVVLGPPSYVGLSPLTPEDDLIQSTRNAPTHEMTRDPATGRMETVSQPRGVALSAERLQGTRETWHYRRDRLPREVRFPEVAFEFLTKDGVGTGVLQRDRDVLMTLDAVSRTLLPKP